MNRRTTHKRHQFNLMDFWSFIICHIVSDDRQTFCIVHVLALLLFSNGPLLIFYFIHGPSSYYPKMRAVNKSARKRQWKLYSIYSILFMAIHQFSNVSNVANFENSGFIQNLQLKRLPSQRNLFNCFVLELHWIALDCDACIVV